MCQQVQEAWLLLEGTTVVYVCIHHVSGSVTPLSLLCDTSARMRHLNKISVDICWPTAWNQPSGGHLLPVLAFVFSFYVCESVSEQNIALSRWAAGWRELLQPLHWTPSPHKRTFFSCSLVSNRGNESGQVGFTFQLWKFCCQRSTVCSNST